MRAIDGGIRRTLPPAKELTRYMYVIIGIQHQLTFDMCQTHINIYFEFERKCDIDYLSRNCQRIINRKLRFGRRNPLRLAVPRKIINRHDTLFL